MIKSVYDDGAGELTLETASVFNPLLVPSRYKGAHGGRGSGKSHFFGQMMVEECYTSPGTRAVCVREYQKTLAQSSKFLIETKIGEMGLGKHFRILHDRIETPEGGMILFQGMQDHTAESIKSLEGCRIAWVEEAQTLSSRSLALLRPTIREEGSEIWFSWNPRRPTDAVDQFLRGNDDNKDWRFPPGAIVVEANWKDNPWFPDVLKDERLLDLASYPGRYQHIWEGGYATAFEGAYFSAGLAQAQMDGRILRLTRDPILPIKCFWDLGGAGASADALSIWICQFAGREIRVLDYIEGQGQVLAYYVTELRSRGYLGATCYLPHDGVASNSVTGKRYRDHVEDAGFPTEVVPNQGRGAAMMRIEAVRRIFPLIYFDEKKTKSGREALGFYHEKRHEERNVGLGPEHDWSSHAADAFGLMAVSYEAPLGGVGERNKRYRPATGSGGWLGA